MEKSVTFDQNLLQEAINGDQAAINRIIRELDGLIVSIASGYHLVGGDQEDLHQEGRVALTTALKTYDFEKNDNFIAYAAVCIKNAMLSAVKSDLRQKSQVLNTALSYSDELGLTDEGVESIVLQREQLFDVNKKIKSELSSLEKQVLSLFVGGLSYKEIAARLNLNTKAVDNALARVRGKLQ